MDDADYAARLQQVLNASALARQKADAQRFIDPARQVTECIECAASIPGERIALLPGIQLCVECASRHEAQDRMRITRVGA